MEIPGHIAVALIQHDLLNAQKQDSVSLPPLLAATFVPDLVDKTIGYILHWMPTGRHYMHNIFSVFGTSLITALIWGKRAGFSWGVGHLGHLIADSEGFIPWFFPFKKYSFQKRQLNLKRKRFFWELLLLILILIIRKIDRSP